MSLGGFWKNSKRTATGDLVGLGGDATVKRLESHDSAMIVDILTGPWLQVLSKDVVLEEVHTQSG